MILALDTLNENFEAFLRHLGVDIPREAREAASALEDEFARVKPQVTVKYAYEQEGEGIPGPDSREDLPGHAVGAIVTKPHVAVVHSNEAIMPIDQLWDQMDKLYGEQSGGPGSVTVIQPGGVQVGVNARYVTTEEQWIAETITRGVIEAIGNNDEPGYQAAITRVVESALKQLGR